MFPILLVDDSQEDLILAERALRACKLANPIRRMSSGEECIQYFKSFVGKDGTQHEPCMLFLDLTMTPIGGIDVLRAIQDTHIAKRSISVMLSGVSDLKRLREGYQLGAKTFLLKPLTSQAVLEFLASLKDKVRMESSSSGYRLSWITPPTTMIRRESLNA
jgi:CheY-like chemotaxis protein